MIDNEAFTELLTNNIPLDLIAIPIAKVRDLTPVDKPIEITADV